MDGGTCIPRPFWPINITVILLSLSDTTIWRWTVSWWCMTCMWCLSVCLYVCQLVLDFVISDRHNNMTVDRFLMVYDMHVMSVCLSICLPACTRLCYRWQTQQYDCGPFPDGVWHACNVCLSVCLYVCQLVLDFVIVDRHNNMTVDRFLMVYDMHVMSVCLSICLPACTRLCYLWQAQQYDRGPVPDGVWHACDVCLSVCLPYSGLFLRV